MYIKFTKCTLNSYRNWKNHSNSTIFNLSVRVIKRLNVFAKRNLGANFFEFKFMLTLKKRSNKIQLHVYKVHMNFNFNNLKIIFSLLKFIIRLFQIQIKIQLNGLLKWSFQYWIYNTLWQGLRYIIFVHLEIKGSWERLEWDYMESRSKSHTLSISSRKCISNGCTVYIENSLHVSLYALLNEI